MGGTRISRRAVLKALGTIAVSARVPPAVAQSAATIGGNGFDAMVAAMKPGSWRKINRNRPHEIALARTKANFDGGAYAGLPDTWPTDAAVAEAGYSGGVGPATGVYAFSKHVFDPLTGRAFHMGGGHASTHDNTIFRFDPGSGMWSIAHNSGRLYPVRGNPPPAWSHQVGPRKPIRSDYWVDVNAAGQRMPSATHTYGTCLWEDGGDRVYISGTYGEISGNGLLGSCWVLDLATNALHEHWYDPIGGRTNAGFSHNDGRGLQPLAYSAETRLLYRYAPWKVYRIADPWNSPHESILTTNGALHDYCGYHVDMVSFIDDTAGGSISLFQHYRDDRLKAQWQYIRSVDRWPTIQQGVYERADPMTIFAKGAVAARGFCRSLAGNTIICWDGTRHLYEFEPAHPFSETRIVRITGEPTGDLPPVGVNTLGYCRIERLPRHNAYICGAEGNVWVYKA